MKNNTYKIEAENMARSYKKLFLIEQYLKENIENYEHEMNLYFHEYIPLLHKDLISEELRKDLYKLVKVRNKICHMKSLELEEERLLINCYEKIYDSKINI